jgi:flagella synthesis protein FlgN
MSLAKHLEQQLQTTQYLVQLLEEERLALATAHSDGPRLAELSVLKASTLQRLEQLESTRSRAQRALGYAAGRSGAIQAAREAHCEPLLDQLYVATSRARQLNQFNGETLGLRLHRNQRVLNFLNEAAGQPLYGPDGRPRTRSTLSSLA